LRRDSECSGSVSNMSGFEPCQFGPSSEMWLPLPLPWPQSGSISPTEGNPCCCIGAGVGGIGGALCGIGGAAFGIGPEFSSLVVFRKSKFESRDFDLGASPDGLGDLLGGDLLCIDGGFDEGDFETGDGAFKEGVFGGGFKPGDGGALCFWVSGDRIGGAGILGIAGGGIIPGVFAKISVRYDQDRSVVRAPEWERGKACHPALDRDARP
jgi:hypothetical protein